jgi:histidinol dehydrogenase
VTTAELLPAWDAALLERASQTFLDAETLGIAERIITDVRTHGLEGLRRHCTRLGDIQPGAPLILDRSTLVRALDELPHDQRALLERVRDRIERFARAQRASLVDLELPLPGGAAGHQFVPVDVAGCYAPGGRFPLPSSVLMTATTARVAGVQQVIVSTPRPGVLMLAAAALAGADAVLAAGGAQAIAALALGVGGLPAADVVCGPGNRFVTAAKKLLAGEVSIDMLAGPSELLVLADDSADPDLIAADLLGQAEHDEDARVTLVALTAPGLAQHVRNALYAQVAAHPSPGTAIAALQHGRAVEVASEHDALELCDRLAPEHLQICVREPRGWRERLRHCGAVFSGTAGAEVFGDYGVGPNHVLPTGGAARHSGGLSSTS